MRAAPSSVRFAVRTCVALLVVGTACSFAILRDFTDAVWFTVQTLTTTGYGSRDPSAWMPALKWFSIPW